MCWAGFGFLHDDENFDVVDIGVGLLQGGVQVGVTAQDGEAWRPIAPFLIELQSFSYLLAVEWGVFS